MAEHLRQKSLVLSVAWRPRDENEEADALTNQVYSAFDLSRRVPVVWEDIQFYVLPQLTAMAETYFMDVQERKKEAKARAASSSGGRVRSGRGTV